MQSRWDSHISRLQLGLDLETEDVQWCMNEILTGNADIEVIKKFLLALKSKGETAEKERIVKGMKKSLAGFKARYGDKAKSVMYATATKAAKKD